MSELSYHAGLWGQIPRRCGVWQVAQSVVYTTISVLGVVIGWRSSETGALGKKDVRYAVRALSLGLCARLCFLTALHEVSFTLASKQVYLFDDLSLVGQSLIQLTGAIGLPQFAHLFVAWSLGWDMASLVYPLILFLKPRTPSTGAAPPTLRRKIEGGEFRYIRTLGSGHSATVSLARWRGTNVAVKQIKISAGDAVVEELLREVQHMTNVAHPHVVGYYGYCMHEGNINLVLEFCSQGSLEAVLRRRVLDEKPIRIQDFLKVAEDVASALLSLHRDGCVHRDLAARNVFVTETGEYKVGDFGLARELEGGVYRASGRSAIPVNWTAPEALLSRQFTCSSDVWSFGVLLWEVLSYCTYRPFGTRTTPARVAEQTIISGAMLQRPSACPPSLWQLLVVPCFHPAPTRPTIESIFTYTIPAISAAAAADNHPTDPSPCEYMYSTEYSSVEDVGQYVNFRLAEVIPPPHELEYS